MKAYKCDICGKYCDYSHNIYGNIMVRTKKKNFKKMKNIKELCDSCFEDLQRYIQDKYSEQRFVSCGMKGEYYNE